ncbi:unnamed protein product, partial [Ectocarpus fasciculatus]
YFLKRQKYCHRVCCLAVVYGSRHSLRTGTFLFPTATALSSALVLKPLRRRSAAVCGGISRALISPATSPCHSPFELTQVLFSLQGFGVVVFGTDCWLSSRV